MVSLPLSDYRRIDRCIPDLMKNFRWKIAQTDRSAANEVAQQLRIPPLLALALANRGCTSYASASAYLEPRLAHLRDPFLLPNMETAVERLLRAHQQQECFVIFGDYDVDGVTSTGLLTEFFRELGWHCVYYLPHRIEDGYGLSKDAVQKCIDRFQPKLLLAVDCGSSSTEIIDHLRQSSVEVIVLDHHQVCSPAPPAVALVNPQLGDDPESRHLCSAGLAFKLAHALLKRCRALGWPKAQNFDLRPFLDLVALGTIADLVPLTGENRIFAHAGLERLRTTQRVGLTALKQVAGLNGAVTCHEVAFQLAPRLNAAGRLETALDALELILTNEPSRAQSLGRLLDEQNRERQTVEKEIVDEVIAAVQARFNPETDFAIVEGHARWHIGVVGIVASRVLREFHRPAVILGSDGSDQWRGSGRSIKGFDLAAGLRNCGDLLLKCGGHAMAAGLTMTSTKLADFRARLNELVASSVQRDALQPEVEIDAEVNLSDLNFNSLKALRRLDPLGQGNPPVHFVARRLQIRGEPKCVGTAQQHRRFNVTDGATTHQALWWNCDANLKFPPVFDLAFAPELNEFNGTFGIQLKVLDLKPSS
jgi:single-stranded-DNA-specific exonuclease